MPAPSDHGSHDVPWVSMAKTYYVVLVGKERTGGTLPVPRAGWPWPSGRRTAQKGHEYEYMVQSYYVPLGADDGTVTTVSTRTSFFSFLFFCI